MSQTCSHLDTIHFTESQTNVCPECVARGDTWVHLRMCLECGFVAYCDSSVNKHATQHFHSSGHPLVRSLERGESWVWCYANEVMVGEL